MLERAAPDAPHPAAAMVQLRGPGGSMIMMPLERGPGAQERFVKRVRGALALEEDVDLEFTYAVTVPWKEGACACMRGRACLRATHGSLPSTESLHE